MGKTGKFCSCSLLAFFPALRTILRSIQVLGMEKGRDTVALEGLQTAQGCPGRLRSTVETSAPCSCCSTGLLSVTWWGRRDTRGLGGTTRKKYKALQSPSDPKLSLLPEQER